MLSPIYEEEHLTLIIKIYDNEIWKTSKRSIYMEFKVNFRIKPHFTITGCVV